MKKRLTRLLVLFLALVTTLALIPLSGNQAQAAFRADVPENMRDNYVLGALKYAGYDVDRLVSEGWLYNAGYIDSNLAEKDLDSSGRSNYLSDIQYWSSSNGSLPNGDNTVTDSSTITGKAPNISLFEQRGMVCGSFITYYLCNYLPNIEGEDTSKIYSKAKELGASGNFYYLTSVNIWDTILSNLSTDSTSGVTKYTLASNYTDAQETAFYSNLEPGDILIFADNGTLTHIAVYAGEYYLYNSVGGLVSNSPYHFIAHVSSDNGPEISTAEYQSVDNGTAKSGSLVVRGYHIDWPVQAGSIEVNKKDPNGKALSGAEFSITNTADSKEYRLGPTDSKGYAMVDKIPFGTYTVKETKAPAGYELSSQTWTVTLNKDTPNGTITINAVNQPLKGNLIIQKHTNTGKDLYGWKFQVKNSSGTVVATVTTDDTGYAIVENLEPGNYTVEEIDGPEGAWNNGEWAFDVESSGGVVVYATESLLTNADFSNGKTGWIGSNSTTVSAVTFENRTCLKIDASTGTQSNGYGAQSGIKNVAAGTYTLSGWIYLEQAQTVITTIWTSDSGSWVTVKSKGYACEAGWNYISNTFETTQDYGTLIAGFGVSKTGGAGYLWQPVLQSGSYPNGIKSTSGSAYYGTPNLFNNSDFSNGKTNWIGTNSTTVSVVTKDGRTCLSSDPSTGTLANGYAVQSGIRGVSAGVYTLSAWVYLEQAQTVRTNVWSSNWTTIANEAISCDAGWNYIQSTYTFTQDYGTIIAGFGSSSTENPIIIWHPKLEPGSPATSWTPGPQPRTVTISAGKTTTHYVTNMKQELREGRIELTKIDPLGNLLAGAKFLLEWSEDGVTWAPVTYNATGQLVEGGCSTPELADGILVTGDTGIVTWEGLYPTLQYRVTEVEAPEGYLLLSDYVYVGSLPEDTVTITRTVVNIPAYRLPEVGSTGTTSISALGTVLMILSFSVVLAFLSISGKKAVNTNIITKENQK